MSLKIEKNKESKIYNAGKWLAYMKEKAEEDNLKQWALLERKYKRKLRTIETRYTNELKKEKVITKNKLLKKEGKVLKVVKSKQRKINWTKKADDIFSLYIRAKYGPLCYTCGGEGNNCGHWKSRQCWPLRRDERNCRVQGFRCCNSKMTGNGKPTEFEANLEKEGIDVIELKKIYLEWVAGGKKKPGQQEIQAIFEHRKGKLNERQLGNLEA